MSVAFDTARSCATGAMTAVIPRAIANNQGEKRKFCINKSLIVSVTLLSRATAYRVRNTSHGLRLKRQPTETASTFPVNQSASGLLSRLAQRYQQAMDRYGRHVSP